MTDKTPITIDGQQYDPVTGLPMKGTPHDDHEPAVHHRTPATHLHATPQRSVTLHRKALKKPSHQVIKHRQHSTSIHRTMDVHPQVRRFAPHPVGALAPKPVAKSHDIHMAPAVHPHVVKAHAHSAAKADLAASHRLPTASEKKTEALHKAIANTHAAKPQKLSLKERVNPRQRLVAVLSAVFAIVLLGGYFTYLNMPALSVRIAAAQAGINADYPNYRPDGYSLVGPVMFSDGRVSMSFKANAGNKEFTINQSKSSWNNDAVLDNYVSPRAGASYIPYTERGLTIYTFDDNAAWVNGGILYTIEGDAPLSSEQIRRIATSLL